MRTPFRSRRKISATTSWSQTADLRLPRGVLTESFFLEFRRTRRSFAGESLSIVGEAAWRRGDHARCPAWVEQDQPTAISPPSLSPPCVRKGGRGPTSRKTRVAVCRSFRTCCPDATQACARCAILDRDRARLADPRAGCVSRTRQKGRGGRSVSQRRCL